MKPAILRCGSDEEQQLLAYGSEDIRSLRYTLRDHYGEFGLKKSEATLLLKTLSYKRQVVYEFKSTAKIAEKVGVSERSIRALYARLQSLGLCRIFTRYTMSGRRSSSGRFLYALIVKMRQVHVAVGKDKAARAFYEAAREMEQFGVRRSFWSSPVVLAKTGGQPICTAEDIRTFCAQHPELIAQHRFENEAAAAPTVLQTEQLTIQPKEVVIDMSNPKTKTTLLAGSEWGQKWLEIQRHRALKLYASGDPAGARFLDRLKNLKPEDEVISLNDFLANPEAKA